MPGSAVTWLVTLLLGQCYSTDYTNKNNGLDTLPTDIPLSVVSINLDNNVFAVLPPFTFSNFPNLNKVSLRFNSLVTVDALAFNGTSIGFLDLYDNQLTSVPELALPTLTGINVAYNQIDHLDFDVLNALYPDMTSLSILANPVHMDNVSGDPRLPLTGLYIGHTNIRNISWIRTFRETLQSVTLNGLSLSHIDHVFTNFSQLRTVLISQNDLVNFPCPEGTVMSKVEINTNELNEVPNFGCVKDTLENVGLQANAINSVPPDAFTGYSNLYYISLRNNLLTSFPCSAISGTAMSELNLMLNSLTSVPNLECVASTLQILHLDRNSISVVRRSDIHYLTNLNTLLLSENQLTCVEEVGVLKIFQMYPKYRFC